MGQRSTRCGTEEEPLTQKRCTHSFFRGSLRTAEMPLAPLACALGGNGPKGLGGSLSQPQRPQRRPSPKKIPVPYGRLAPAWLVPPVD